MSLKLRDEIDARVVRGGITNTVDSPIWAWYRDGVGLEEWSLRDRSQEVWVEVFGHLAQPKERTRAWIWIN